MNNDPVFGQISHLLSDSFEVEPAAIDPKATLADLQLDSLAVVEFYVALGEYYNIPLSDSDPDIEQVPLTQLTEKVTTLIQQKD